MEAVMRLGDYLKLVGGLITKAEDTNDHSEVVRLCSQAILTLSDVAVLKQELDKAIELNEWYRKRCVWYQQELDAQSRAETMLLLQREQVCADLRRELEMTRQRAEDA